VTQIEWERVDNDRIDDATLALLLLTLDDNGRAWKSFDWETMNRLHEKGFISDPKGKQQSVALTEEGQARAVALFQEMFVRSK
jgi:hypothetical protein